MGKSVRRPVQKFRKDGRCSKGAAGYGYFTHKWEVIRKTRTHDVKQCIHCGGLKWVCAKESASDDVDDLSQNTGSRAAQQERNQALDDAVLSIMAELKAEGKL